VTLKEEAPGVWRGDLWHQGRRIKLTFRGTSKDAKEYEAQRRLEIAKAGIVKNRQVLTFAAFVADKYEPAAKLELSVGTWRVRPYKLKPLRRYFGAMKLTKITEQHIEGYKQMRRGAVSKATVNGELNVLSAIFTYAHHLKIPCASPKIRRFKVRKKKGNAKAYTRTEVGFILAAAILVAPRFFPVVKFLFETGCRKSEAINLPWARVDLDRRHARIWNETDEDDDRDDADADEEEDYEVKSNEREVPLSDGVLVLLREQRVKVGASEWVFPVTMNRMYTKGDKYWEFPDATWARVLAHPGARFQSPRTLSSWFAHNAGLWRLPEGPRVQNQNQNALTVPTRSMMVRVSASFMPDLARVGLLETLRGLFLEEPAASS
jgi:integrase